MTAFAKEQRIVVTGASSGIGEGVALRLNELGATVIGIGRDGARLEAMKAKALHPENVFLEQKDLAADIPALVAYMRQLKDNYGSLHGLAYCAGVSEVRPLCVLDYEAMQRVFAIDYFAPVFMAKGFANRRVNHGEGSAMVFVASRCAVCPDPGMATYSGAKGALVATMRAIAKEIAHTGVRVNCVSPALVETKLVSYTMRRFAERKYPMGLGQVSEVADMVAYLLGESSRRISGQNYVMDGAME